MVVQLLDKRLHEDGLNVPPAFPSLHNMTPVGLIGALEASTTVTVSVVCDP